MYPFSLKREINIVLSLDVQRSEGDRAFGRQATLCDAFCVGRIKWPAFPKAGHCRRRECDEERQVRPQNESHSMYERRIFLLSKGKPLYKSPIRVVRNKRLLMVVVGKQTEIYSY